MKVAIVGGGVAGLTLANALSKLSIYSTVFEKSRGLGGRTATKRLDWGHIDIGAQYFTARDPRFMAQVEQWVSQGLVAEWAFSPYSLGLEGLKVSSDDTKRFVGIPRMNGFIKGVQNNFIDLQLNTKVEGFNIKNGKVRVNYENSSGKNTHYDWIIFSTPAEQSRVLLAGHRLSNTIPKTVHSPCWAVALATQGVIPDDIQGVFGDEVISWASRLNKKPGRTIFEGYDDLWMLHFSGQLSTSFENEEKNKISQMAFNWLSEKLASNVDGKLELINHHEHFWRYARVQDNYSSKGIYVDEVDKVAVIGDWTQGGRIEGAYLSALDLIDKVFLK